MTDLPDGVYGYAIVGRRPRTRRPPESVPDEVWQLDAMRTALRTREIAVVYGILQRFGVSQRRIAALTGQSQSEISEIRAGRRVVSYDVLVKIADGLGVPRGWMGLAHDDAAPSAIDVEMARIDALPFPAEIRVELIRAFVSGIGVGRAVAACVAAPA